MSGHSHYATTKRQKELKDNARGKVFSKLARSITIAVKTGGSNNPDANLKLKIAIDKGRAVSMPKDIIDRAISKAAGGEVLDEIMYEGFGPAGIAVLVEVATDNKNRTNAEIRNLFEKSGGKMGSPGSVSFGFSPKGIILVKKQDNVDDQLLKLIDLGAEDVIIAVDLVEVYVEPGQLSNIQKKLSENGFEIDSSELIQKPMNMLEVPADKVEQVNSFLENLDNQDDVQKVFTNANY